MQPWYADDTPMIGRVDGIARVMHGLGILPRGRQIHLRPEDGRSGGSLAVTTSAASWAPKPPASYGSSPPRSSNGSGEWKH
jgi:hypothetical protein